MSTELTMPMLGEVMEEGVVLSWKKQEGEAIEKGEIILEIETDKAVAEVESPASGVVKKILVQEGETVPVNTPLAVIE
ncbi:MAG TPA: biotin/lipoyl-containing protein [Spirochaetia bacterium]|nr:biotin/lipoyl-containing protein [Spirochaetia bacterium]